MDTALIEGLTNAQVIQELWLPYAIILLLFLLIFFLLWRDGRFRKAKDELIIEQHTVITSLVTNNTIFQSEMVNQFNTLWGSFEHYNKVMHNFAKYWLIWMITTEEGTDLEKLKNKDLKDIIRTKQEKIKKDYENR